MSEPRESSRDEADGSSNKPREITDARTMRALAHPTRLALLDVMRREGELTATRAAELLDDSPGNMSWHLQTLAKYGFVEETGEGKGRSRPWRIAPESNRFIAQTSDPKASSAGIALVTQVLDRALQQEREWLAARANYPKEWQNAAFVNSSIAYMTPDEVMAMCDELVEVFRRYDQRTDRDRRPEGTMPINLTAFGHPLPPTESGN